MKAKKFEQLTDLQKSKVQERINQAFKRIIEAIDFLQYQNNEDKKATIFLDTIDIYHRSVSNIIERYSFKDNLYSMLILSDKRQYISNKI